MTGPAASGEAAAGSTLTHTAESASRRSSTTNEPHRDAHDPSSYISTTFLSSIKNAHPSHPLYHHFLFAQHALLTSRLTRHHWAALCIANKCYSEHAQLRKVQRRLFDLEWEVYNLWTSILEHQEEIEAVERDINRLERKMTRGRGWNKFMGFIRSKLPKKVERKSFSAPMFSEQSIKPQDYEKGCRYSLLV